jgi:MoaA/NifB/PqqE/SkfB family radical SAM enzyme
MANGLFARYWNVLVRTHFGMDISKPGIWNYIKHYFVKREILLDPKKLSPVLMNLTITKFCNLKCPWCGGEKPLYDDSGNCIEKEMTAEYVGRLLDTPIGRKLLLVTLTGGEPLLNKEVIDIIKTIKQRKLLCGIITNGLLLKHKIDELLKSGLDEIQVSLHDFNNAYKELSDIIPLITNRIPVHGTYVLTRDILENNPRHVDEIIIAAKEMGCRSLRINLCSLNTIDGDTSNLIYDDNKAYKDFIFLHKNVKHGIDIYFPEPLKHEINGIKDKNCKMPWQRIQIDSLGHVSMCCFFRFSNERQGDFLIDQDDKTYNSDILKSIRSKLLSNDNEVYAFCKYCNSLIKSYATKI